MIYKSAIYFDDSLKARKEALKVSWNQVACAGVEALEKEKVQKPAPEFRPPEKLPSALQYPGKTTWDISQDEKEMLQQIIGAGVDLNSFFEIIASAAMAGSIPPIPTTNQYIYLLAFGLPAYKKYLQSKEGV